MNTASNPSRNRSRASRPPKPGTFGEDQRRRPRGGDEDGHDQRQEQDRQQQVARARVHRDGRKQCTKSTDARVGQQQDDEERQQVSQVAALDEEEREHRDGHRLDDQQEDQVPHGLREEDRDTVDRAEQQPVEAVLVLLLGEGTVESEQHGEDERHPEHAAGEVGEVDPLLDAERVVEDHHRQQHEEDHADDHVARAQLADQVLAQDRLELGPTTHSTLPSWTCSRYTAVKAS